MKRDDAERVNHYAGCALDRAAERRRDEAWIADRLADPTTRILPVWRGQNLVLGGGSPAASALAAPVAASVSASDTAAFLPDAPAVAFLGMAEATAHFAVDLSHIDDPATILPAPQAAFVELRSVGPLIGHQDGALLAYARGLLHWHARHRFCGVCGSPTVSLEGGHLRRCTDSACAAPQHPRTDPAVIMLVSDGDRLLLGHQPDWSEGMYSVLAGFVEPGESLEDAVRREVFEEVGIAVDGVRYHSSQPWPFPASIMLGFTARACATALHVATDELADARWFTREELQNCPEDERFRLPRRVSIARRLIEDWLAE